jgi:hypothetical protein
MEQTRNILGNVMYLFWNYTCRTYIETYLLLSYNQTGLVVLLNPFGRGHGITGGGFDRASDATGSLLGIGKSGINLGLASLEKILQEGVIQELGSFCLREHCPKQKGQLYYPPKKRKG